MDSRDLAHYIESTDGASKSWLLVQLRLKKLEEIKASLPPGDYVQRLQDIHRDLMALGEWWGEHVTFANPCIALIPYPPLRQAQDKLLQYWEKGRKTAQSPSPKIGRGI